MTILMVDLLLEKRPTIFTLLKNSFSRIKFGPDIDNLMQSKWQAGLILLEMTCISFHIPLPASMVLNLQLCFASMSSTDPL